MKTFESVLVTGHLSAVVGGRSLGPHGEFGRSQLLPVCLLLFAASLSLSLLSLLLPHFFSSVEASERFRVGC